MSNLLRIEPVRWYLCRNPDMIGLTGNVTGEGGCCYVTWYAWEAPKNDYTGPYWTGFVDPDGRMVGTDKDERLDLVLGLASRPRQRLADGAVPRFAVNGAWDKTMDLRVVYGSGQQLGRVVDIQQRETRAGRQRWISLPRVYID